MKVLFDNVLVIPDEEKEKISESGLYLGTRNEPVLTGTVYKAGEGTFNHGKWVHNEVKENDKVQFGHDYQEVKIDGSKYYLMKQTNVVCIF